MSLNKLGEKGSKKKKAKEQRINMFLVRYFKWLVVLFVLIVFISSYIFLIKPKYQKITQLVGANKISREQEYLERKEYLAGIKDLINIYKKINLSDIKKVNLILSKGNNYEELFTQLESIVLKSGLLIKSLKIDSEEYVGKENILKKPKISRKESGTDSSLPSEIGRIKVTLSIIGVDYFSLKNILNNIENNLMIMDIISLDFQPSNNSVDLDFYTYYLK